MNSIKKRHGVLWICLIVLLFLLVFGLAWLVVGRAEHRTSSFRSEAAGISLRYSPKFYKQSLSTEDERDKIVLRLTQTDKQQLPMQVAVRYEEGIRLPASITRQNPRDMLIRNIDKAYPDRFKNYKKVSSRSFSLDSRDAAEIIFTYSGPSGQRIRQRFVLLMRTDDKAVYISAQSKEVDFAKINKKYFDPLFASIQLK